jgi:WD40 repeat protein
MRLDLATDRVTPLTLESREATSLEFMAVPDGTAQTWSDGAVTLYDRAGGAIQTLDVHRSPVRDVRVIPDRGLGVTVGDGGQVELWDIDPGSGRWSLGESLVGHSSNVWEAEVSDDGRSLLTASSDGQLVSWDLTDDAGFGSTYPALEDRWVSNRIGVIDPGRLVVAPTRTLSAQPRGFDQAAGAGTGSVAAVFLSPRTGRVVDEVVVGNAGVGAVFGSSVAVSPDTAQVAVTSGLRTTVLDSRTREVVARLTAPRGAWVNGTTWTPDGSRLLLGSDFLPDGSLVRAIHVVDTTTWEVERAIRLRDGSAQAFDWSDDGSILAVAINYTSSVILFDRFLRELRTIELEGGADIFDLSFSPDGTLLAAGSDAGLLSILDTKTWKPVHGPAPVHAEPVLDVEWLADSSTVVTAGKDETVSMYDVERDIVRSRALPASNDPGDGATFLMPDPRDEVIVMNEGGPGHRYPVDPARWLARACAVAGRDLTHAEWERYMPDEPYRPVCDLG